MDALVNSFAVVGCGFSLVGKGLGSEIDGHDFVIRANRAHRTDGIEKDWGSRTDLLVIGNPPWVIKDIPKPYPFAVVQVPELWRDYKDLWPHDRKPLAGTFAAMYACRLGAKSITLYGIDLYCDSHKVRTKVFKGYHPSPPRVGFWDLNLDRQALLNLPCKVTWVNPPLP